MKRIFTILICLVILCSLVACSGKSKDATSGDAQSSNQAVPIKIMANFKKSTLTDSDNAFIKKVEDATKTKLDFNIPPSTGYNEKLQIMLVSGKYPDVVMFKKPSDTLFQNAVDDGVIIPINDYLDKATNVKEYTYDVSWDALTINKDGKIYGIPRTSIARNNAYVFRKDWLDNLGITVPQNGEITIDEFTNIVRRFTFDDPDQNGVNDTFGYSSCVDTDKVMTLVLNCQFGDLGWQKSDGPYDYMAPIYDQNSDVFKKELEYTRNLYLEGILNPDSTVNDQKTIQELFFQGTAGVKSDFAGNYRYNLDNLHKFNPKAEIVYAFVKNLDGEVVGPGSSADSLWNFWSITQSCEYPEKVMEIMDYILSDEGYETVYYGIEGVDYNLVDGKKEYVDSAKDPIIRYDMLRRAKDSQFFIRPWVDDKDAAIMQPIIDKSVDTIFRSKNIGYEPPVTKEPYYQDIKSALAEGKSKILLGELEVDAYDDLLKEWYENGGEDYIIQMNEYIKSME